MHGVQQESFGGFFLVDAMFFQPQPQQMQVQVPIGLGPGATFAVQTPSGMVQVQVPAGVVGGMNMMIAVPAQPVQVVQAPQPMVMVQQVQPQVVQQQPSPPPAKKAEPEKKKKGAPGLSIYKFNLNTQGDENEGCCDANASPVGQFKQDPAKLPPELKDVISPESWELMVPKFVDWQAQVGPCIVPAQETCCMSTGGCCCACAACLMMQLSARDAWEVQQGKEINDMLAQYDVKLTWEKGGVCPDVPCCVKNYANFVWV